MSGFSKGILKLFGWTLEGEPPSLKKYVIIIAPHTSNWDFFIFLLVKSVFKLQVVFIGKHTIFVGPFGWLLRKIGGLPVERSNSHNVVEQIADEFKRRQHMIFALSPEGTRSYKDHWKSGFYHIAKKAKVPIQTAFLNATDKTLGWGPLMDSSLSEDDLLKKLALFYEDKKGIRSSNFSQIKFHS